MNVLYVGGDDDDSVGEFGTLVFVVVVFVSDSVPVTPAPTAAAMVAIPTHVTVAVRRPARMNGIASGSSTLRSRCQLVMPTASATSITVASTPLIPA